MTLASKTLAVATAATVGILVLIATILAVSTFCATSRSAEWAGQTVEYFAGIKTAVFFAIKLIVILVGLAALFRAPSDVSSDHSNSQAVGRAEPPRSHHHERGVGTAVPMTSRCLRVADGMLGCL
ncbi:MAG: hypothetical protein HN919_21415 [Verrucomicrobia bacterium]|jgi:hypothetical protein|nr:hypothetical protein [Verrucomicrobiota bacterium]